MSEIDWSGIESNCKSRLPGFNQYKWQICKNQLISIGIPLDAVAFIMSVPETCVTPVDVQRISMAHYPVIR